MTLSEKQLAAEYQPLDRDAHIAKAIRLEKPSVVKAEPVSMFSADPTHRAVARCDTMLDAIELITERRACGCWTGATCCRVCADPLTRLQFECPTNPTS